MKKYIISVIFAVIGIIPSMGGNTTNSDKLMYKYPFAPSEGYVNKVEKDFRKEICLNGYWSFQPQPLPKGYSIGKGVAPEMRLPDDNLWDDTKIKIPSPWNINAFANNNLAGPDHRNYPSYPKEWEDVRMAWMKKTVKIPADWNGMQLKLHFEAVAGYAEVYVNKHKVADNFDLFLPFDADITQFAKAGETVEVLVGVRDQALFEDNSTVGRRVVPAGSMWGYLVRGIWQDVYLVALPKVNVENVFVKPLVSKNTLELEVTVRNNTVRQETVQLQGIVDKWLNKAGTDINSAPVPAWELGAKALDVVPTNVVVGAGSAKTVTIDVSVAKGVFDLWTPDTPNLYALILSVNKGKTAVDKKYERFGWREWTISGTKQCLNGEPFELRGDSWHFMGIPQMTRRYAWAWFTAIKNMNGNAVRLHAQVYPKLYMDMADEMGICVLDETANWASDGGPKLDSEKFWAASKEHLRRFVLRDRNHPSVFGWSISNENRPVILYVFNRPDLMKYQRQAWKDWRDIVMATDPTRPWISSDGEDDGEGILPVTVGHYGDLNAMKNWVAIGKPWGIGEHSMAYYGTPEQVSKYNGEEAYTSQYGRMEGLANEVYGLISDQRNMGASYVSVFNMAWYGLKPLPLGKKDLSTPPSLTADGVFFKDYTEGVPGVQPERMGPYCTTFNPGYDPSLPLYETWPMFDAMRAAYAPGKPVWSPYKEIKAVKAPVAVAQPMRQYKEVVFIGADNSKAKKVMAAQNVIFSSKMHDPRQSIYIIDGSYTPSAAQEKDMMKNISKGTDVWIWNIQPQTVGEYNKLLPLPIKLEKREISSFIPVDKSWMTGLQNSDFYFCEVQKSNASDFGLSGALVQEGDVLLNACNTNWRRWNKQAEEIKTAAVLRSENEAKGAAPAFVRYQGGVSTYYVSTLSEFANSEKGYNTLATILKNAGIPCSESEVNMDETFFLRDGQVQFPAMARDKFTQDGDGYVLNIWVFSPRPLDNLLIEPNMPKLALYVESRQSGMLLNGRDIEPSQKERRSSSYNELPLRQGWNEITLKIGKEDKGNFNASFRCDNNDEFLSKLKVSFTEQK